jgi:Carboxypeptidase regulatory-like domain
MKLTPIAVLVAAATFSAAQDPPPGGAVEGTVVNSVTGAGISGASVTLLGSGSVHYATKSDAAGRFKITGMSAGDYRAVAHKDGFAPPDLRSLLHSGLHVTSATDAVKVELKLTPFDAIQGRVLDPDGKPFAGVEVILNPDITADSAVTDQEGRFALANLRPGSFLLIAKPKRVQPKQASNGTRTAIVSTYYPSATDPSVAQQIVLRGEGDSSGL